MPWLLRVYKPLRTTPTRNALQENSTRSPGAQYVQAKGSGTATVEALELDPELVPGGHLGTGLIALHYSHPVKVQNFYMINVHIYIYVVIFIYIYTLYYMLLKIVCFVQVTTWIEVVARADRQTPASAKIPQVQVPTSRTSQHKCATAKSFDLDLESSQTCQLHLSNMVRHA